MMNLQLDSTSIGKKIVDALFQPVDLSAAAQSLVNTVSRVFAFVVPGRLSVARKQAESINTVTGAAQDLAKGALILKERIMGYWHWIRPYQPTISAVNIAGKATWKNLNCHKTKKEIDNLSKTIYALKGVLHTKKEELRKKGDELNKIDREQLQKSIDKTTLELAALAPLTPSRKQSTPHKQRLARLHISLNNLKKVKNAIEVFDQLRTDVADLEKLLNEKLLNRASKRVDLFTPILSVLQLGSLSFPHPGSNAWNSFVSLCGRFYPLKLSIRKQSLFEIALGTIASVGTLSSFLEQTEVVREDNPLTDCAILAAMVVHAVEFVIMVKGQIPRAKKHISNLNCFCFFNKKK